MSAGRSVTLDGRVGTDIWAAGETVTVDSPVGNNGMLAGRTVNLGRKAVIGHDARLAGNTVTAEGRVERNLDIGARRHASAQTSAAPSARAPITSSCSPAPSFAAISSSAQTSRRRSRHRRR
jgi:hypothetical protein